MSKKFAHSLKEQHGREITTKCGLTYSIKPGDYLRAVVWWSEVTCPKCIREYRRFHARR